MPSAPPDRPAIPPIRVLIVDDEPSIGSALTRWFALHGMDAVAVGTPLEARREVHQGVDAIVMDYRIGAAETGVALYRALVGLAPELDGRCVFMTGDISERAADDIATTDCLLLVKPFAMGLLVDLVRSVARDPASYSRESSSPSSDEPPLLRPTIFRDGGSSRPRSA